MVAVASRDFALALASVDGLRGLIEALPGEVGPEDDAAGARADLELARGIILRRLGRGEDALRHLRRARRGHTASGDQISVARCNVQTALVEMGGGRLDPVQRPLQEAKDAFDGRGCELEAATCNYLMGIAAQLRVDLSEARSHLEQAQLRFHALDRPLAVAACLQQLAVIHASAGDPDSSLESALRSIALLDDHRYLLELPSARLAWVDEYAHTISLALRLALDSPLLGAELIETVRSQAIPSWKGDAHSTAAGKTRLPPGFTVKVGAGTLVERRACGHRDGMAGP